MKEKTLQLIERAIQEKNLQVDMEEIKKLLQPAVGLKKIEKDDENIPVGHSKFGGIPDLPKEWDYPSYEESPLSFLCQINLAEIPFATDLPQTGVLYFFFEDEEMPSYYIDEDPNTMNSFRVLYFDGDRKKLQRNSEFLEENGKEPFPSYEMSYHLQYQIPEIVGNPEKYDFLNRHAKNFEAVENDYLLLYFGIFQLLHYEKDEWLEMDFEMEGEYPIHSLLGYAYNVQEEAIEEILDINWLIKQSTTIEEVERKSLHDKRNEDIGKEKEEWQLLLQLDTDDELDWMWGDMGRLYFAIKKEDLQNKNFSNVGFTWQCS